MSDNQQERHKQGRAGYWRHRWEIMSDEQRQRERALRNAAQRERRARMSNKQRQLLREKDAARHRARYVPKRQRRTGLTHALSWKDDKNQIEEHSCGAMDQVGQGCDSLNLSDEMPSTGTRMESTKDTDIKTEESQPQSSQTETEGVRTRPGRRAARLAAEKIQKTVRKYGLFNDDDGFGKNDDFDVIHDDDEEDDEDYTRERETVRRRPAPRPSPVKKEIPVVKRQILPKVVVPPKPTAKIIPPSMIHDMDLYMECTEEVLSQAQIAALKKAGEAYDTAMRLLRNYRTLGARIIYSHDTVHASTTITLDSTDIVDDVATVVVHTTPSVTPTTTTLSIRERPAVIPVSVSAASSSSQQVSAVAVKTTPTPAAPATNVAITAAPSLPPPQPVVVAPQGVQLMRTVGNQQTFIVAATPVQGVPAPPPPVTPGSSSVTYKVLIDSRTGVVVGTLPNEANLVSTTPAATPTTTRSIAPAVTPSVQKKTSTVVEKPQPAKPPPLQKATDQSKVKEQPGNKATAVPLVTGGSKIVTAHSLLAVKLHSWKVSKEACAQKIEKLKNWLDESKFTEEPIQWMIEHRLLPEAPMCSFCSKVKMELVEDTTCFDGVKWHCPLPKCGKYHVVSRMSFFARFGVSMAKLLSLVYHWAIQSDIEHVMKEISVDIYMIRSVWRAIQEVCARAVSLRARKLGGAGVKVEVNRAQIGRFLVLAAYDRSTLETRLKVVSVTLGWNSVISQKCLESWLLPKTVVLSCDKRLTDLQKSGMHHIVVDASSASNASGDVHLANVTKYLETKLNTLFGDLVVHQLKLETIQGFLDELQWRERYSKDPSDAFWNILRDIAEQCGRRVLFGGTYEPPEEGGLKRVKDEVVTLSGDEDEQQPSASEEKSPEISVIVSKDSPERRREPKKRASYSSASTSQPARARSPSSSDESDYDVMVVLDEYYYATKDPNPALMSQLSKGNYLFRCHICKKVLDNNVKAMKHISGHIENKRHKNLDLSDLTQCKYCYRDFETPYSMQCHMEQVHLKTNALACRICNQAFPQTSALTKHMKMHHKQAEMPYSCQACEYRSSFQREILEHFQQEHSGTDKLLCHYCLKIYNVTFSKTMNIGFTQMFYYHLYKHQCKTVSRKCPQCCLVFLNLHDLKNHRINDHESKKDEPGVHPMKATDPNPILVKDPHKSKKRVSRPVNPGPPSKATKMSTSSPKQKSPNISAYLEEKQINIVMGEDTASYNCLECKNSIDSGHFVKYVSCGSCRYATNCVKAFTEHMICSHSNLNKKRPMLMNLRPVLLPDMAVCDCGFSTTLGNNMANHIVNCELGTCNLNPQHDFVMGLGSGDLGMDEPGDGDFYPDPSALCQIEMVESVPTDPSKPESMETDDDIVTRNAKDNPESSDRPDMLNALGLVRRKSMSDPPSTPSSVDENSTAPQEAATIQPSATAEEN